MISVVTPSALSFAISVGICVSSGDGVGVDADRRLRRRHRELGVDRRRAAWPLHLAEEVLVVEVARVQDAELARLALAAPSPAYCALPLASPCAATRSRGHLREALRLEDRREARRRRHVRHARVLERLLEDLTAARAGRAGARREVEHRERLHRRDRDRVGALGGLVLAGRLHELQLDLGGPTSRRRARTPRCCRWPRCGRRRGRRLRRLVHEDAGGRLARGQLVPEHDDLHRVGGHALRDRAPAVVTALPLLHARRRGVERPAEPPGRRDRTSGCRARRWCRRRCWRRPGPPGRRPAPRVAPGPHGDQAGHRDRDHDHRCEHGSRATTRAHRFPPVDRRRSAGRVPGLAGAVFPSSPPGPR